MAECFTKVTNKTFAEWNDISKQTLSAVGSAVLKESNYCFDLGELENDCVTLKMLKGQFRMKTLLIALLLQRHT